MYFFQKNNLLRDVRLTNIEKACKTFPHLTISSNQVVHRSGG